MHMIVTDCSSVLPTATTTGRMTSVIKPSESRRNCSHPTMSDTLESNPRDIPLKIYSDSKITIDGLTGNLKCWEEEGFQTIKNGQLFQATVALLRERTAPTTFEWVKGHSGVEGNEATDKLAAEGCAKPEGSDLINMQIKTDYIVPGAKLAALTQSSAYKILRQEAIDAPSYQAALDRFHTARNMVYAQDAAIDLKGETPSQRQIWKSVRHKDLSRTIRFFLWMLIHNGYKVGSYWNRISGSEHRGVCDKCGVEESMDHILTKCKENGQKQIWKLASKLWFKRTKKQLQPLVGEIMACAQIKRGLKPATVDKGTTRLYRFLVSESAFLIWRLQNERRIQGKDAASEREIYLRWKKAMNIRLDLDCRMINKNRYGNKAVAKPLVLSTWTGVLQNEDTLPADWTGELQGLAGIG
ncbi:hypothetical protein C8R43DRAFT_958316 [Mycena crocata]|nr:hypothetical protein C8R43DRAFT_958316 [Mycena crocata]